MTHPTDEELDALVQYLRAKGFISQREADAITAMRADLAEMKADRYKWFEGWGTMHVAAMREAQRADQNAIRADRAEAALAAQIEADAKACDRIAGNTKDFPAATRRAAGMCAAAIRAQPHDRRALDRMLAEAREKALREAAEICSSIRQRIANGPMPEGAWFDYEQSILALIEKPHDPR